MTTNEQRRAILQAREAIESLPVSVANRRGVTRALHGVVDALEQFVQLSLAERGTTKEDQR